jgi:hypothetical protein
MRQEELFRLVSHIGVFEKLGLRESSEDRCALHWVGSLRNVLNCSAPAVGKPDRVK